MSVTGIDSDATNSSKNIQKIFFKIFTADDTAVTDKTGVYYVKNFKSVESDNTVVNLGAGAYVFYDNPGAASGAIYGKTEGAGTISAVTP